MAEEARILTVTELNEIVKGVLETSPFLTRFTLRGEISNFTRHYSSGHLYFSLKDEGGVVKAVMFKTGASKLAFQPENGMKVIAHGKISVYAPSGQYQILVTGLEPDGVGALYIAYEQLKRRLEAEGLFSPARKKPLPKIPTRIGIITSPTGAAVRDMIHVTGRRFPYAKLLLYPATVQGDGAVPSLLAALDYFERKQNVDVIIIGRGGGSIEDLWAFNSEELARKIAQVTIPVISAVGHETDFTICDFVADMRAPTPSAAAEIAVPETAELKRKIQNIVARMQNDLVAGIAARRQRVENCAARRVLTAPMQMIDDRRLAVAALAEGMDQRIRLRLSDLRRRFVASTAKLEALNPMAVISRGYAALYAGDTIIQSVKQVAVGDTITFRTADGSADTQILAIHEGTDGGN